MRIPNTAMKRDTEEIRALNNFNEKGVSAMKILVFGAGVLGCNLANSLFKAGKDVTLLARGKWAEEIKENGLRIKNRLLPSDVYDIIFVALRYTQLEAAADALRANKTKNIILVGNNVRADETAALFPEKNVMFAFTNAAGHGLK